uniref:Actin-binding Rho-activating protein n=1 Tax=Denticeps clupeoides TaxID=299321 RepID=A0AAY4EQ79_9TELE
MAARKTSTNKNIKKLRAVSAVCSLARSWQKWVSENEEKQSSEPSGWAPAVLGEPEDKRVTPREKKPPLKAEGAEDEGDSRIRTKQVVKSVGERMCTNMVSEVAKGWKEMEKEKRDRSVDTEDSGFSEAEERSPESEGGAQEAKEVRLKRPSAQILKKKNEEANKINSTPKKYSTVGNLKSRWQNWASEHEVNQKLNPFSEDFDYEYSMQTRLRKGEEGYGRPKEGSKTAERAKRAEAHIHREIEDMCFIIRTMADPDPDGRTRVTFGELFDRYVRISDKVVGILMRARKHGKVAFEGEMLWQGQDDGVIITLLV